MNVLTFSGNLGRDAELRATKNGDLLLQFSVAMNSGYGERKATTWVRCTLFGKRGESLKSYLTKGQQVVVSGEASLHEWTTEDGTTKSSLECKVNEVTLVGGKPESKQEATIGQRKSGVDYNEQIVAFDDLEDLPF
jgi:single-strand DNA-binding protein